MEVEIVEFRNETVPSLSSLVETFDKVMNEMPMGIMSEEHMIRLRNCCTQLKDRYQKMETQTGSNSSARDQAQTGSNSSGRNDQVPKGIGFGGLVVTAAIHFGLSAAIPRFQGPKHRVMLCILNLVISVLSFASAATIACIPLLNNEAKNLKHLWKQSLLENGKYRSMIRVAAYLIIFAARVAILIYTAIVKNKMKVPNFDLSCVPGVADCWSVYRELYKKKSHTNVTDLESDALQHPYAATTTQHHSATFEDQASGAAPGDQSAVADLESVQHPSAATTTQHHSAAFEDQVSGAAPGDQGHQVSGAAPVDQGDDAAGASGADSGDQGAVADLESVQHPSAATTTQHHSAALEDQASVAAPGDQGHQDSGAAPGDQGDEATGASGADSRDQGAVADLESVQHPSAATTTQHHSAALEDKASGAAPGDQGADAVGASGADSRDQGAVADLESVQHPSTATTTQHHSAAFEDQAAGAALGGQGHQALGVPPGDQGDDAAGASGADSGDQGAAADLESIQHPSAATTTQHHSAALEDQASSAAPGDQGHQALGAAPGDQGDDAAGASDADSGDQSAVADGHG